MPVLIVAVSPGCLARVGGLPLVVRAVLALRAAGFPEIAMFARSPTEAAVALLTGRGVERELRWIHGAVDATAAAGSDAVLVLSADLLFDPRALSPLVGPVRAGAMRLGIARAAPDADTRVAVCSATIVPALVARFSAGSPSLARALREIGAATEPPRVLGPELYLPLDGTRSPRLLTHGLLADLARRTAQSDGYLAARLDRHVSRFLSAVLVGWPVTPNQITVASIIVGLAGAAMLATVSHGARLAGVLALMLSSVLDGVDGEVARARFEESLGGARLDLAGDYAAHLATFVGLGIGLARGGLPRTGVWVAVALVAGVGAAMAAMHALVVRPTLTTTGDLHGSTDTAPGVVQRLAGRDYTYLLLLFALAGHLEWFVYAAAVGSWVFALGLLVRAAVRRRPPLGQSAGATGGAGMVSQGRNGAPPR